VTSDLDIHRSAKLLIDQHGDAAPSMVATMIREFIDLEDPEGIAVWRRIRKAVEELLANERPDGVAVH
jgi:hypothetical protein